jgi:Uncharacterised nucleotidyltransferase
MLLGFCRVPSPGLRVWTIVATNLDYGPGVGNAISTDELWRSVDQLIDRGELDGILAHKVGPLAALRCRALGRLLPKRLVEEERAASLAMLSAVPLLRRIRDACDGPLLLLKGPELAHLYPPRGRRFGDVDVLSPQASTLHRSLTQAGFVAVPEPGFDHTEHHHLVPLRWPVIQLNVEVHLLPNWPLRLQPPPLDEILEAAVPSVLGIEGLDAPGPLHHTLILAAHAWKEPLRTLRDLIDVAVVAAGQDPVELNHIANAWGIERIWQTTERTSDALFFGGSETMALRLWARHLATVRERTVFENHLQRWLRSFWGLPLRPALAETGKVLRAEITPAAGETWREKLTRVPRAVRDAGAELGDRSDQENTRRT